MKFTLMPWPVGTEDHLLVLPPERWREMLARIRAKSMANPRVAALERVIGGNAVEQSLDKVGRICLPETMSKTVGVGKEVELVGRLDKFEVWNPQRYETASAEDKKLAMEAIKEIEI
ncbi:MAG: division/cell wall cluster transcriptional repressor MraZ [Limisphaerales bacterium]